jgi:predicted 3-demethylubiquinone-9 3-methyltransferase (glyoxalase superfamily)
MQKITPFMWFDTQAEEAMMKKIIITDLERAHRGEWGE